MAKKTHIPTDAREWEALFEHPQKGFITLAGQVHSTDALQKVATVIITELLKRVGDKDHLKAHIEDLKKIAKEDGADVDKMREDVTNLLRQVKEECIEAAVKLADKPVPEKKEAKTKQAQAAPPPAKKKAKKKRKKSSGFKLPSFSIPNPFKDGFTKLHGIIAGVVLVVVIGGGVGINLYLKSKERQEQAAERAATVEFIKDYISQNRPADTWEVKDIAFNDDNVIKVDVMITDERHVNIIVSKTNMIRQKFVESLCPPYGQEVLLMLRREWKIWIALRSDRFNITGGSCKYQLPNGS